MVKKKMMNGVGKIALKGKATKFVALKKKLWGNDDVGCNRFIK